MTPLQRRNHGRTYFTSPEGQQSTPRQLFPPQQPPSVDTLIASPRKLPPLTAANANIRRSIQQFDNSPCMWDPRVTWGEKKNQAIRMFYLVMAEVAHEDIATDEVLGAGSDIRKHVKTQVKNLASCIIGKFALGPRQKVTVYRRLRTMFFSRQGGLEWEEIYYCFVLPLAKFFHGNMNPNEYLGPVWTHILEVDIKNATFNSYKKAQDNGIWSYEIMDNRRQEMTVEDGMTNDCCGVLFIFARVHRFLKKDWPYKEPLHLTPIQRQLLVNCTPINGVGPLWRA